MTASETQVGGTHYKDMPIQPSEYIHRNGLGFMAGNIVKYVTRYKSKGGKQDLEKAAHYLQILIAMEYPEAVPEPIKAYTYSTDDGWIPWDGGECPVDCHVQVQLRNSEIIPKHGGYRAATFMWQNCAAIDREIIAYRVATP